MSDCGRPAEPRQNRPRPNAAGARKRRVNMNRLEIMKRRILLLVLAAVFVLPAVARTPLQQRLEKLERAVEVTPLESTCFDEKYELVLRQPLDWQAC